MIFLHRQNNPKIIDNKNIDGIELDIRSYGSKLILTHDRIEENNHNIYLEDILKDLTGLIVIVNVKESGLEEQISKILDSADVKYYFLDSQIPDIIRLCRQDKFKGKFIIRVSDFEEVSTDFLNYCQPNFLWVDYSKFDNFKILDYINFINKMSSDDRLKSYKKILVSPELYGLQNINTAYDIMKSTKKELLKEYSVCTTIPDDWRQIV